LGAGNVNKKEESVKRLWLAVVLVALGGLASRSFADVQNIRLSGDIRIRGYFLDSTGLNDPTDTTSGQKDGNEAFISQRTRVSVEADLEDHVLVVVTLAAEGMWGAGANTAQDAGAGLGGFNAATGTVGGNPAINHKFDVGIDEAYVQLNELFYTPATLKLGRQYLHYGHGLIISSVEQEYNYDAGRLVLDYYPLTIDLVGAELVNNQSFAATPSHLGASDLLFVNARYELSDSAIKNVEAYFGWVSQSSSGLGGPGTGPTAFPGVPPTTGGASPMIIGLRTDINPADAVQMWAEGAYEFGADGANSDKDLSAGIFNLGAKFTMKDTQWVPAINGNYIFATGGGKDSDGNFAPWFDYAEGYNGYLFEPSLSNIHIFNVGASVKPYENTTLAFQTYYYMKASNGNNAGSNGNVDFGGIANTPAADRDLGWELDGILGYDYSKDVRAQLVYGAFIPQGAYEHAGFSRTAEEVRAELNVKF